jgi:hypothetical protein
MRIGAAGPHLGRNPDRFNNFLLRGSVPQCRFSVTANAVGTLGDVRHRNCDELLRLRRQCAIRKYGLTECIECSLHVRPQLAAFASEVLRW